MFSLTNESEIIPIHEDPTVKVAHERLVTARTALDALAADEHKKIKLVLGREDNYTDDEMVEARRRLEVVKGTQNLWFLPEAQAARDEAKKAEFEYQAAVIPAREKLIEAATAKIATLTKHMDEALEPVRELALKIEEVRHQMSDGGARPIEHTCSALLPGGVVDFQLRNAKTNGWI